MVSNLASHIEALERALLTEQVRTNQQAFLPLLHDAFFEFGSSGRIISIAEDDVTLGVVDMSLSHFQLHVLSEQAVLATYRIVNHATNKTSLRSSIWRFDGTSWRLFFHQGTNTEEIIE